MYIGPALIEANAAATAITSH